MTLFKFEVQSELARANIGPNRREAKPKSDKKMKKTKAAKRANNPGQTCSLDLDVYCISA